MDGIIKKFLDSVQDIFYDIFGFMLPGLILIFLGCVYYLNYSVKSTGVVDFLTLKNIEVLLEKMDEVSIGTNLIIILSVSAYFIGAGINVISKMIYKIVYTRFYDEEKIFKDYRTILEKYYEFEFDNEIKDIIYKREHSLIRKVLKNDKSSLISKYIAKYNLFLSVKLIFFVILIPYQMISFIKLFDSYEYTIGFIFIIFLITIYAKEKYEKDCNYLSEKKYQNLKVYFFIVSIYLAISSICNIGVVFGIMNITYNVIFIGMLRESQRHIDLRDTEQNILLVYRMLEKNRT